jgi:serine/threonine protein kinase
VATSAEQTRIWEGLGVQDLLAGLRASTLLSADDFDQATKVAADPASDGHALAKWLVTSGLLTAFQLDSICTRNFAALRVGNYEVLDRLGAGGMGTVFKARHRRMKRVVALKVLLRTLVQDEHFVQRFQREVETIARLSHPNIVMAFDADEAEVGPFLVMEFVDGRDLASLVQKGGPLSVFQAVDCILQGARGLDYAHSRGIIHRDVKPDNLLLDVSGVVKVADLGLARVHNPAGPGAIPPSSVITQVGGILGTVSYMAPEQAVDSTAIDHLADVYSLGASLYYLLTGRPPYTAQSVMAILLKHRDAPIPSLAADRDDVPAELDAVFRRMVAKTPSDRIKTMTDVVAELDAIRARLAGQQVESLTELLRPDRTAMPKSGEAPRRPVQTSESPSQAGSDKTIEFGLPETRRVETLRVVLVEPSRTQAGIIRTYLQTGGIRNVGVASSGQEALTLVWDNCPDAIVSAMHLADLTGVELARRVREAGTSGAPGFVLISSEADGSDADALGGGDRAILLRKPFTPDGLLDALKAVTTARPSPAEPSRRGKLRVLIVDDSAAARMHARKVLEGLGFRQFAEAADGAGAVSAVARDAFDLIVTDYNMPFMDGRGLIGYLKQNPATAKIPVIMVTTEDDPEKIEAVRRLGVAAVCDKSFRPEAVRAIVDRLAELS